MKRFTSTSNEILSISASELRGYSVEEIADMIRRVQAGTQDGDMTEEQIMDAARQIYEDANQ